MNIRSDQHSNLVRARKSCRICMSQDPGKICSGAEYDFDPDVVSHWSQWLGHPAPHLLIIGQDFGDRSYFERHRGTDDLNSQTNINLHCLLTLAGLSPGLPPEPDEQTKVYLTNSILCLKEPPMNRPISSRWIRNCAANHLRPLLEELKPTIVVAMGARGWEAARYALDLKDVPRAIGAAAGKHWPVQNGATVFAVGHCGPLGLVNRGWPLQRKDWEAIGEELRKSASSGSAS